MKRVHKKAVPVRFTQPKTWNGPLNVSLEGKHFAFVWCTMHVPLARNAGKIAKLLPPSRVDLGLIQSTPQKHTQSPKNSSTLLSRRIQLQLCYFRAKVLLHFTKKTHAICVKLTRLSPEVEWAIVHDRSSRGFTLTASVPLFPRGPDAHSGQPRFRLWRLTTSTGSN